MYLPLSPGSFFCLTSADIDAACANTGHGTDFVVSFISIEIYGHSNQTSLGNVGVEFVLWLLVALSVMNKDACKQHFKKKQMQDIHKAADIMVHYI